ncbi:hypothetical protein CCACVL1_10071 [Corchorus capsularis]|uniref:Uncharacterized protein n=1 Tax=Corchorus capsularis TaxID=210143 RepID=A0A1R3ISR7_COCAP|nr:hypothetical protein CCACVL1_10071 [Corchorus capsularis]
MAGNKDRYGDWDESNKKIFISHIQAKVKAQI